MSDTGLSPDVIDKMRAVFRRRPRVAEVRLFGSRAKGTFRPESDIDLVVLGITDGLEAEAIADELDELPLPYRFEVKAYDTIRYTPLREHIDRVGVTLYVREVDAPMAGNLEELGYGPQESVRRFGSRFGSRATKTRGQDGDPAPV